jgi:rhodanese-related sulfurtransferase
MKYPTHIVLILFLALISLKASSQSDLTSLSAEQFSTQLKMSFNEILLDVRTPEEFKEGHIPEAINMDWENSKFKKQAEALDKSRTVFVYCYGGGRSSDAAAWLRKSGFERVLELKDGFADWEEKKYPVAK